MQLLEAHVNSFRDVFYIRPHFACYIEPLSRDLALLDRNPKLALGIVAFGTVEVIITEFNGRLDPLDDFAIN